MGAVADVEARAVARADKTTATEATLAQSRLGMRAAIRDRVQHAVHPTQREVESPGDRGNHGAVRHLDRSDLDPLAHGAIVWTGGDEMTDGLEPGAARCPGPSTADILRADSAPPPEVLLRESPVYLGSDDLPYTEYTSPDFARLEHDHVWSQTWQWACREEHIPEPGDYEVYDVGDRSALVMRGEDGVIRAFYNACLHRGTQLKPAGSSGFGNQVTCPFHGWTWSTNGTLTDVPCEWDFPHVDKATANLPEIRVELWGGFVFVNWSDDAPDLEDYLGELPEHFANWNLAEKFVELHVRKRLPANWKAAQEAFLEAYHVKETHPQSIPTAGDANAQYDVFGDHVSRFVHTAATPSPHVPEDERLDDDGIIELLMARKNPDGAVPTREHGETARDVYARWTRDTLGERYGIDVSDLSTSEAIDSIEYFLFPNAFFFPGLQFPMVYRFRPDGHDVDHSIFDLVILRPVPDSGRRPEPATPYDLDVDDSYTTVPGIQQSLGAVYDQDTSNLAAQTRGFRASAKQGQTLGNYQEIRTRHLHDTINRYITAVQEGQAT